MTRLCELGKKYGTDKYPYYTPFYDLILGGRPIRKVLEIGIGTPEAMKHVPGYQPGASLRMWAEYCPDAEIWGIDVEPGVMVDEGRIHSFCCNTTIFEHVDAAIDFMGEGFDLIVDDGDHSARAQLATLNNLRPLLAPGGLYIIEDASPKPDFPIPHSWVSTFSDEPGINGNLILIQKDAVGGQ